ncbi:hypothetical protein D3C72_831950 [compost metagenome]
MSERPTRRKSSLKKFDSIFFSSAFETLRPLPSMNSRMTSFSESADNRMCTPPRALSSGSW